jgi:hypothetical protein
MSKPQEYYIFTTSHGNSDEALFWRPEHSGYTRFIVAAGRYSKTEVNKICKMRGQDFAIPCEIAEERAMRMVPWDSVQEFVKEKK